MAIASFTLANRLRAGETVYSGWCGLPYPLVAETLARDGFSAVTIESQHGLWDVGGILDGVAAVRQGGAAPIVRVPLNDFALGQPRARFRRRRHHRADDQYAGRRAGICRSGQISADRRAQLGPAPRHDAWPDFPTSRSICAKPTITSSRSP